jgi:hypothetical protein
MILIRCIRIELRKLDIRNSIGDDSQPRKVVIPNFVSNRIVLLTIKLNANFHLGAVKVKTIGADRMLSPKLESLLMTPK